MHMARIPIKTIHQLIYKMNPLKLKTHLPVAKVIVEASWAVIADLSAGILFKQQNAAGPYQLKRAEIQLLFVIMATHHIRFRQAQVANAFHFTTYPVNLVEVLLPI